MLRELIERMPVELWLARLFGDSPVLMLSAREVGQQLTTRESFLGWLAFCDLALSMLELKTSVPILEEMHGARAGDLALARDRALDRDLARARDLARDLALDRVSNDTANTWGGYISPHYCVSDGVGVARVSFASDHGQGHGPGGPAGSASRAPSPWSGRGERLAGDREGCGTSRRSAMEPDESPLPPCGRDGESSATSGLTGEGRHATVRS